jgi:hypothetical protein
VTRHTRCGEARRVRLRRLGALHLDSVKSKHGCMGQSQNLVLDYSALGVKCYDRSKAASANRPPIVMVGMRMGRDDRERGSFDQAC